MTTSMFIAARTAMQEWQIKWLSSATKIFGAKQSHLAGLAQDYAYQLLRVNSASD